MARIRRILGSPSWIISLVIFTSVLVAAYAIRCYQCDSNKDLYCSEKWNPDFEDFIKPEPCDNIYEAKFCIKATGMYGGEIGTKRFCSSRDRGDYCDYIRRPGDDREYRSCIHTCQHDGCNSSNRHLITVWCPVFTLLASVLYRIW